MCYSQINNCYLDTSLSETKVRYFGVKQGSKIWIHDANIKVNLSYQIQIHQD